MEFNNLLVPIDLSPVSESIVRQALAMVTGDEPVVILLHVIDSALVEFAAEHEFGTADEILAKMKDRALRELKRFQAMAPDSIEVDVLVSEGRPFLQIVQKAEEFLADAIVMGKVGGRGAMEKLLFGSTAEKVLRTTTRPVVVLPLTRQSDEA